MAASVKTFSTTPSSSSITDTSITFIVLPGMSQVISAMPSASTSNLKLDIRILLEGNGGSVRLAVQVQHTDGLAVAFDFQVFAWIVRAFARYARADFEQQNVSLGLVYVAM